MFEAGEVQVVFLYHIVAASSSISISEALIMSRRARSVLNFSIASRSYQFLCSFFVLDCKDMSIDRSRELLSAYVNRVIAMLVLLLPAVSIKLPFNFFRIFTVRIPFLP